MEESEAQKKSFRIVVTGNHDDLDSRFPKEINGRKCEWLSVPVLSFERLPVSAGLIDRLIQKPADWILFTSQRSVQFWAELLMAHGVELPVETQVACIGSRTAEAAKRDGFDPEFYPNDPGTEGFLKHFEKKIASQLAKPSIFIPMAEGGRPTIRERLAHLGCEVISVSLYRSVPREDISTLITQGTVDLADAVLFTSPLSATAFLKHFRIPPEVRVVSIGRYTFGHLKSVGLDSVKLPQGDFSRIGEVLC
ncbi:MAG: uroporphyrinogen-III synthase [Deltaproteobacteria bacterium]|nr:uroporphyrinogen-III synthase [Deltaproteobacteria bacterium]